MNYFLLSADVDDPSFDHDRLQVYISQNRAISEWVSLFRGAFMLRTEKSPLEMKELLAAYFGGDAFVVARISPMETGGALPNEVWDWINREYFSPEKIKEFRDNRERKAIEAAKKKI